MGAPRFQVPKDGLERHQYFARWHGLPTCWKCGAEEWKPCIRVGGQGRTVLADWMFMAKPHRGRTMRPAGNLDDRKVA